VSADPPKTVPSSGGKVPLVSEVLERLVAELGGEASRRPAFFQAALQVCSEELRSVKAGGQAATLEELVARSRKLLGAAPTKGTAAAAAPRAAATPPPASPPASAAQSPLPFPDEEPTKQHVLPGGNTAQTQFVVADDDLFTIDEPSQPTVVGARSAVPPPAAAPAATTVIPAATAPRSAPTAAAPVPVAFGTTAPAASLRTPVPPTRPAPAEEPLPLAAPTVRDLFGSLTGDSQPLRLETPTGDALGEPYVPTSFEPYGHDAPSSRSRRTLLRFALGGMALVAVVVAGLWLFGGTLREAVLPETESAAPTPPATPRYQSVFEPETGATGGAVEGSRPVRTAVVQPTRAAVPTPIPTVARPTPAPARRADSANASSQAAVMVSPDWATRPPSYAIHFSSYQDRARAERDAADIGATHGRPAAVAAVDLGARGLWYRVVLTGFASYEEARAYHSRLRAQGTPGIGGVYYVVGPE
jgi:hypothetical protein